MIYTLQDNQPLALGSSRWHRTLAYASHPIRPSAAVQVSSFWHLTDQLLVSRSRTIDRSLCVTARQAKWNR